jgi:3-methyladenine DNA glycosylase AlkD
VLDLTREHQYLLARLRQHADPGYQAGSAMVMKTRMKVYGVRVPDLRQLAASWKADHKQLAGDDLLALADVLWSGESLEEHTLANLLLASYPKVLANLPWEPFDRWRRLVDNWGVGDALGTMVFGPWLMARPDDRLHYLDVLIDDEDLWSRRLALVATVPLNRRAATAVPGLTLELVDRVKHEREPMISKAVSWALRELSKSDPDRVAAYVSDNRTVLASQVVREVQNKLATGLKSGKNRSL